MSDSTKQLPEPILTKHQRCLINGIDMKAIHMLMVLVVSLKNAWWRHQMETFSALLALCAGNSPVPVNSPHKGQWRVTLISSLIGARINDWVNNREAGDLRRYRGHYDVIVMTNLILQPHLPRVSELTHLPIVPHIYTSVNSVSIDSDNDMSPIRRQAIIWTNAGLLSIGTVMNKFQWNFNQNTKLFIDENAHENIVCEMAAIVV